MKLTNVTNKLYDYLVDVSLREHPVLSNLRSETAKLPLANMQVSPEQAQFMQFLIKSINAKYILELGTFTGYSALAMSLALPDDGRLITCDISENWTKESRKFWKEAGQENKIELRIGPALKTLSEMSNEEYKGKFDFIFIDADKTNYVYYYEHALELISPSGIIAIDNIFWEGKVVVSDDNMAQTREIRRLNKIIQDDDRVDISLLTVADGLFLVRKKA
ncbi:MAG: class I SAM-dependent methyltransferase [Legionellaceae bacterium]|nr:class I SAM-dependent methyltransferase [Legionellaceae bacterium]